MKALFCGDISPTPATGPLFGSGDYEALFTDITGLFQKYDASIVNLECALTEHETQIKKIGPPRGNGLYMRYANPEEAKVIFDGFEERSKSLQDGTWMDGWVAFCESKRESYTQAIARFNDPEYCFKNEPGKQKGPQMFGHYLDCEAHQDVWRTLFPTFNRTNEK